MIYTRRKEDRSWDLVVASRDDSAAPSLEAASIIDGVRVDAGSDTAQLSRSVILLDPSNGDPVLIAGAEVRSLPRGDSREELLRRAEAGAAEWRREHLRSAVRIHLPDRMIAYAEQIRRAGTRSEVIGTLSEWVINVIGGYVALTFFRDVEGDGMYHPVSTPGLARRSAFPAFDASMRLSVPGTISAAEIGAGTGGPLAPLATLFRELGAASVLHIPFTDDGLFFLVERRRERVLDAMAWDLFRSMVHQAELVLERIELREQLEMLRITDPLTGLANGRRLEELLSRDLAHARRGSPLTLMLVRVESNRPALRTDAALHAIARELHTRLRGADLPIRVGEREILIALPATAGEGAKILMDRLVPALHRIAPIRAALVSHSAEADSASEMLAVARAELEETVLAGD